MRSIYKPAPIKEHFSLQEAVGMAIEFTAIALFLLGVLSASLFLVPIPQ